MTLTVEVKNQGTLSLLQVLENMGLLYVHSSAFQNTAETVCEGAPSYLKYRGIHKNLPGGSVNNFLARSREDKEYKLAIEKRHNEERDQYIDAKTNY